MLLKDFAFETPLFFVTKFRLRATNFDANNLCLKTASNLRLFYSGEQPEPSKAVPKPTLLLSPTKEDRLVRRRLPPCGANQVEELLKERPRAENALSKQSRYLQRPYQVVFKNPDAAKDPQDFSLYIDSAATQTKTSSAPASSEDVESTSPVNYNG